MGHFLLARELLSLEDMNPAERITEGDTIVYSERRDRSIKGNRSNLCPRRRVPDPRRAVVGCGDDPSAIGREGDARGTASPNWRDKALVTAGVVRPVHCAILIKEHAGGGQYARHLGLNRELPDAPCDRRKAPD